MTRLSRNPIARLGAAALAALALLCLGGVPVALAHEGGAPEWGQFQGGPGHPGLLADGPAPPYKVAWTFRAPTGALSGAVVTGDVAIVVGKEAVYGIDLATGEEAWQLIRNGGPLSIPAVGVVGTRQILVFVDESPIGASLVGVDLGDRSELWRTPLKASSRSGVTIDGTTAFVADEDGNVYAVSVDKGAVLWSAQTIGEALAPPAASDGNVYVVARNTTSQETQLVALDERTGKAVWPQSYSPPVAGSAGSGPAAADGAVVVGFADRLLRALPAKGGPARWMSLVQSLFSPASAPAFQPGNVYAADVSGGLYRLNAATGTRDWDYQFNELVVRSSPVVSGETALLGLNDGRLVAVDIGSGELVWQSEASPGAIGPIALSHELVVAVKGGSHPGLVAFEHDPSGALVRIPSPTVLDAGELFGNYAIALAIALVALFVPFRILAARIGPAPLPAEEEEEEEEDEGNAAGDEEGEE